MHACKVVAGLWFMSLWGVVFPQSFKLLTGSVNSECLQLILAVLKPKQSVEDVMEEEEGEKEEEEEEEEEEEDGENSSSSGEEEEEVVNGVDAAFSDEVRRALGSAAAVNSDGEVNHTHPCADHTC